MADPLSVTPQDIIDFWFPDGEIPEPQRHLELWTWRMRGGANADILEKYSEVTARAEQGAYDGWAETPLGRLALIIVVDQFPRTVWAGSPRAYSLDPKALALCLEGLDNGHFDALENVRYKSTFKLPLEHCECPDHLANLDRAVMIGEQAEANAPDHLKEFYAYAARQPKLHRDVIARFGRHSHRNAVLGRPSTAGEIAYIETGNFPHQTKFSLPVK